MSYDHMDIDDVYIRTGEFGRFQWQAFAACCLYSIYAGTQMVQNIFAGFIPDHMTCSDNTLEACDKRCPLIDYSEGNSISYATEWNMTCDASTTKIQSTQAFFMAGVMVGSFFMGSLGDKYGRLRVLLSSYILSCITGFFSSLAPSWIIYVVIRSLTGFFLSGVLLVGFVLTSELVGPSKRGVIGTIPAGAFAIGIALLSLADWYIQSWRIMTGVLGAFGFVLIPFLFWWYEESPRWHLGKGNIVQSQDVLKKIARVNGHELSDINLKLSAAEGSHSKPSLLSLLTNSTLRRITFIQVFSWFSVSAVYYGLTLASGDVGDSRHLSVVLNAMVEIPSNFAILYIMNFPRFGRVKSCVIGMLASSFCCSSIYFMKEHGGNVVTLACAGKFFIVGSFAIIYVQGAELYPTPVRNVGLGVLSVFSRVGGIVAPLIVNLNSRFFNSHFLVFGILGCLSGFLCLLLPETLGRPLPDTPEQIYGQTGNSASEIMILRTADQKQPNGGFASPKHQATINLIFVLSHEKQVSNLKGATEKIMSAYAGTYRSISSTMDIDDVYIRTGEFGRFQWKVFFGCLLVNFYCGTEMVQNMFAGAIPKNQTCMSDPSLEACDALCDSIEFHDDFISYATEWEVTCGGTVQTTQSIYMTGVMTGSFFMGGLGDKFGRFPVLVAAQGLCSLLALLSSFPTSWILYVVLRFFTGFFLSGIIIVSFVLTSELVGPSKRGLIGTMPALAFSLGISLLAFTAWVTQNWRTMSIALGVLGLIITPAVYFLYEESPRWYLGKGHTDKCKAILQKISKTNRHEIGDIELKVAPSSGGKSETSLLSLFQHRILRKITVLQLITWYTASTVYYGLTIASGDMGDNRYVSVIFNALVEVPANLVILIVMNLPRVGRVKSICGGMIISSLFCGSIWLVPVTSDDSSQIIVALTCASKFFMVMAFSTCYVQAGELYPTPVRNVGLGVVSISTRIGGIMAPQFVNLSQVNHNLPFIVFGILGCISGVLVMFLPESLGRPLPESPEDLYKEVKRSSDGAGTQLRLSDKQKLLSDMTDDEEETRA
ncbi:uncharacterized protein [Watersipora subatra]|uniref:uncharacterized protein n=1 Tax=Watersipora subatra TaxID=2589382 RepID=UPI00355B4EF7